MSTAGEAAPMTVAYLMSRFPTVSETFILYEMIELERAGLRVEVFPLIRERVDVVHPGAESLIRRAQHTRLLSRATMGAQLHWLRRRPRAYLDGWRRALLGNARSPRFLARALVVVPLAARFAQRMDELGVDRVHAHWATHPTLAAYIVQRLTGRPYSFTGHAHDIYVDRAMLEEKIRRARFVVTISEFNRGLLTRLYGPEAGEKTVVVRCGVDPTAFPAGTPSTRESGDPVTILCVASLKDYKGHRYLLDACRILRDKEAPFRCLLVGEGEDRPQIEKRIAHLGLGAEVEMLGQLPRDRVAALMREADLMVLPSVTTPSGKMEGIPVSLMEALAVGLPAVATSLSGVSELIEDGRTGLLVPEGDAEQLADAIERLIHDPELAARLASAGREKVMAEFDLRRNAAVLRELIVHGPGLAHGPSERMAGTPAP